MHTKHIHTSERMNNPEWSGKYDKKSGGKWNVGSTGVDIMRKHKKHGDDNTMMTGEPGGGLLKSALKHSTAPMYCHFTHISTTISDLFKGRMKFQRAFFERFRTTIQPLICLFSAISVVGLPLLRWKTV